MRVMLRRAFMRFMRAAVFGALPVVAGGVLASCRSDTGPPEDLNSCPAALGEFGAYGCLAIAGQVVGSRGQPLSAISVGLVDSLDAGQFTGEYAATDAGGRFVLRPVRWLPPPRGGEPDSVSLWIRAVVVPRLPQMVATVTNRVLVRARVAPPGAVPDTSYVTIVLPVP
jgi:hypothetical protein